MIREIDTQPIDDTHIASYEPIRPPVELKRKIVNRSIDFIIGTRQEVRDILHGRDARRLLMRGSR